MLKRIIILLAICCNIIFASPESFPSDSLRKGLEKIFSEGRLGGRWGLSIWSHTRQTDVLSVRADDLFMPASTAKLFVTAAVLDAFPENTRFHTRLELNGIKTGRTFSGVVKIIGMGDPGLTERFYPENQPLASWVDTLRSYGIDTIKGDVITDEGYFQDRRPLTWERSFFDDWYGAEISALTWNENLAWLSIAPGSRKGDPCRVWVTPDWGVFDVRSECQTVRGGQHLDHLIRDSSNNHLLVTGTVGLKAGVLKFRIPVRNPAENFRKAFIKIMTAKGLMLQHAENPSVLPRFKVMDFAGITLEQAVMVTNSRSHNLFAEMLLRHLSQNKYHSGNVANGLRAELDFLKRIGLSADAFHLTDGSGLSYQDRISPRLVSRLLASMLKHPRKEVYIKSLAGPGIGTGGRRMAALRYPEVTRFKTGFVDGTQGLSGYIVGSDGDTLCISLNLNDYKGNDQVARAVMDRAWVYIADMVNQERLAQKDMQSVWKNIQSVSDINSRIDLVSKAWLGRPYLPKPLGDGIWSPIDKKPMAWTKAFDDRSYVEQVLAVAMSPKVEDVFEQLLQLRYFGSKVDFQDHRVFFYPDAFVGNSRFNLWSNSSQVQGSRLLDRRKVFALAGISYPQIAAPVILKYMPMQKALDFSQIKWDQSNRVFGFGAVSKFDGDWYSHLGFLIVEKGQEPILRHASVSSGKVVDESLGKWLKEHRDGWDGISIWEIH